MTDMRLYLSRLRRLTDHQQAILRCRCQQGSIAEVTTTFSLSPTAVRTVLRGAYKKMEIPGQFKGAMACYVLGRADERGM